MPLRHRLSISDPISICLRKSSRSLSQAKPISISSSNVNTAEGSASSSSSTTHHGNGGGAISYTSFSQHSTPLAAAYKTVGGPVYATAAPVLATATAAPVYPQHQYAVVSGSYKVAGGGAVAATPSAVYAPYSVYPAAPVHYGSHLYQPSHGKVNYVQLSH